jgi:two-component system, LytTR family, response regulator
MTQALKALIVDDEPLARALLREFLSHHADVQIVGESDNGQDAVRQIEALAPELVLLDIQMPQLTGLDVLRVTGLRSGVIFTTAHDQHALAAFDLHAVDYLLKPFSQARFDEALTRARALRGQAQPALDRLVEAPTLTRLLIRDRDQVHVVPVAHISCIEAQGDYVAVHFQGRHLLKLQALSELERQLDASHFVRVHRSFIIRLDQLVSIERQGPDGHLARLRDGQVVPISRRGHERLRQKV